MVTVLFVCFVAVHLVSLRCGVARQIEEEVAAFMGTEEAISYSDSATTIASAIPAFAKKGDLTIVDQVGAVYQSTTTTTTTITTIFNGIVCNVSNTTNDRRKSRELLWTTKTNVRATTDRVLRS